jgi:cathepsin L
MSLLSIKGKLSFVVLVISLTISLGMLSPSIDLKEYDFTQYVKVYNKAYSSASEYQLRQAIFESNLAIIRAHNANPSSSWKMGLSHLTDYTHEEFVQLLGYKPQSYAPKYQSSYVRKPKTVDASAIPTNVDWRLKGIITDVKDQGRCGSCWTFGTVEVIESYHAMATGQLHVLSEQQILDCTPNPNDCGGTGGCGGGITEIAYEKIIEQGGLAAEWTYPYLSYFGNNYTCQFQTQRTVPVAVLKSYVKLPSNQYEPVMDTLANIGPLAINVDAGAWHFYSSGVFTGCNKTESDIDHVVLLVGYGTDPQHGDYWLIRNSWAPSWGEDGYIRIARSSNPICTPDHTPQDGTGCNGGPSMVTVCGECGILYDTSYPVLA